MRKLYLIISITIYSIALTIPSKVYTTINSVNGDIITINEPLPLNGMSAIVVRDTPNGEYALLFAKQLSPNKLKIIDKDPVGGTNLAKIKPIPKVGDRVIGGLNYNKALILAPKDRYNQIVSQLGVKDINPKIYEAYIANKGSSNYKDFAKLTAIGLVIVTKGNTIEVIDAISGETILKESLK